MGELNLFFPNVELFQIGVQVILSIICGGAIGLEREMRAKAAGLKTNMLICVGACLYTIVGALIVDKMGTGDPTRISAQIVSGIGFLGAGTIIQARGNVVGLTTAATIWVVAAIGLCIGAGFLLPAVIFTVTVLFTLMVIDQTANRFIQKNYEYEITLHDDNKNAFTEVMTLFEGIYLEHEYDFVRGAGVVTHRVFYRATEAQHRNLMEGLAKTPSVGKVKKL